MAQRWFFVGIILATAPTYMASPSKHVYVFGDFRLDPAERALYRGERPIPLPPKLLDTLALLVENSGRLVEKSEFMSRLWPDVFVEEVTLAHNISKLRRILGEGNGAQPYIETVPKAGYRFVVPVKEITGEGTSLVTSVPEPESEPEAPVRLAVPRPRRQLALLAASLVLAVSGLLILRWMAPSPAPRVLRMTRLTNRGRVEPLLRLLTDGTRLFYTERAGDHWSPVTLPVAGGQPQPLAVPLPSAQLLDLSPNQSELLLGSLWALEEDMPLWTVPVVGGAAQRLGDVAVLDAAWSPDGLHVVYGKGRDICLMDKDGTHSTKLATTSGLPGSFAWSPDGRVLRFSVRDFQSYWWSLWEASADGKNLHRLLPDWNPPSTACCGRWTPDGKYFVFVGSRGGKWNVWALPEKASWLRRGSSPVQITSGPIHFFSPVPGKQRGQVFAVGHELNEELMRFDRKSAQVVPYLAGIGAKGAHFSRDGTWLTFAVAEDADFVLWRSKADGSERLQLTSPASFAVATAPRISPDGTQIAFVNIRRGSPPKVFLVSRDGGAPQELLPANFRDEDPDWSPDGKTIAYSVNGVQPPEAGVENAIFLADLATKRVSKLLGSEGLSRPKWSPDALHLAAVRYESVPQQLMLFDVRTQHWKELQKAKYIIGPEWSSDASYLYYQDLMEPGQPIYRIRTAGWKRERVASFEAFLSSNVSRCAFAGLTPDGSPVVLFRRGLGDIYALDLDLP